MNYQSLLSSINNFVCDISHISYLTRHGNLLYSRVHSEEDFERYTKIITTLTDGTMSNAEIISTFSWFYHSGDAHKKYDQLPVDTWYNLFAQHIISNTNNTTPEEYFQNKPLSRTTFDNIPFSTLFNEPKIEYIIPINILFILLFVYSLIGEHNTSHKDRPLTPPSQEINLPLIPHRSSSSLTLSSQYFSDIDIMNIHYYKYPDNFKSFPNETIRKYLYYYYMKVFTIQSYNNGICSMRSLMIFVSILRQRVSQEINKYNLSDIYIQELNNLHNLDIKFEPITTSKLSLSPRLEPLIFTELTHINAHDIHLTAMLEELVYNIYLSITSFTPNSIVNKTEDYTSINEFNHNFRVFNLKGISSQLYYKQHYNTSVLYDINTKLKDTNIQQKIFNTFFNNFDIIEKLLKSDAKYYTTTTYPKMVLIPSDAIDAVEGSVSDDGTLYIRDINYNFNSTIPDIIKDTKSNIISDIQRLCNCSRDNIIKYITTKLWEWHLSTELFNSLMNTTIGKAYMKFESIRFIQDDEEEEEKQEDIYEEDGFIYKVEQFPYFISMLHPKTDDIYKKVGHCLCAWNDNTKCRTVIFDPNHVIQRLPSTSNLLMIVDEQYIDVKNKISIDDHTSFEDNNESMLSTLFTPKIHGGSFTTPFIINIFFMFIIIVLIIIIVILTRTSSCHHDKSGFSLL